MDSGPFRSPQPAERRGVPSRSEQTVRQPEPTPQPVKEEPRQAYRAEVPSFKPEKKNTFKRIILPIIIAIILITASVIGFTLYNKANNGLAIDSSKYQAVFFTNGQVYFGKLQASGSDYLKLTDIFYLQAQSTEDGDTEANPQATSSDQNSNVQLIKLGNEVHGPEDQMIISKEQVLFYENLKVDGKVAQSIEKYKAD